MASPRTPLLKKRPSGKRRERKVRGRQCTCCDQPVPFCWSCVCGLCICHACMEENKWGLTCNDITWQCPDCGRWHGFGNN